MIRKMNVNILGVVENMSGEIFGQGAGEAISEKLGIKFLGRFELHKTFSDMSAPVVLRDESIKKIFAEVLEGAMSNLSPRRAALASHRASPPAVDGYSLARHVGCGLRGQVDGQESHLPRLSTPPHGNAAQEPFAQILVSNSGAIISVWKAPGAMVFTVTPLLAHSRARLLVNPSIAALEVE